MVLSFFNSFGESPDPPEIYLPRCIASLFQVEDLLFYLSQGQSYLHLDLEPRMYRSRVFALLGTEEPAASGTFQVQSQLVSHPDLNLPVL